VTPVDAICLTEADNVATTLRPVRAGERIIVSCNGRRSALTARDDVPLCHKVALADLRDGHDVLKYGLPIGVAIAAIAAGTHVHIHNMRSKRVMQ
jgi:hypothetical protein